MKVAAFHTIYEKLLDLREKLLGKDADTRLSSENNSFERLGQCINEPEKDGE